MSDVIIPAAELPTDAVTRRLMLEAALSIVANTQCVKDAGYEAFRARYLAGWSDAMPEGVFQAVGYFERLIKRRAIHCIASLLAVGPDVLTKAVPPAPPLPVPTDCQSQ